MKGDARICLGVDVLGRSHVKRLTKEKVACASCAQ
jgi:hypothetical protein